MLQVWSWGETWFIINCISNLSTIYTFLDGIKNWGFTKKNYCILFYNMTYYCLQLTLFKQILAYYYIAWCLKECFDLIRYLILKKCQLKWTPWKKFLALSLQIVFQTRQSTYTYLLDLHSLLVCIYHAGKKMNTKNWACNR